LFSDVLSDEINETEALGTSSGDWLRHCPVFVSESELCRTDEDERLSFRTSIHSDEELEGICGIKLNPKWVMRCFLIPWD
jgi:hypothetical protein